MYTAFDRYLRGAQSPCQYCSVRVPACHGTCQKYIEFKTEFERLKEANVRHINSMLYHAEDT